MPSAQRPLILLTADAADEGEPEYRLRCNYAAAVVEAGGAPLMLPHEPDALGPALSRAQGLIITGTAPGVSLSEARRDFDRTVVAHALALDLPVLGICHGMQVLGEALGGTVQRDLPHLNGEASPHIPHADASRLAHSVNLAPGCRFATWNDGQTAEVNSLHRHVLDDDGDYRPVAWAPDGLLEAFEGPGPALRIGVQWHPEYRLTALDRTLFQEFVRHCAERS